MRNAPLSRALLLGVAIAAAAPCVAPRAAQAADANDPKRIAVKLASGISATRQLSDPALVRTRKAMIAKRPVSYSAVRALADRGDGWAALIAAKKLEERDDPTLAPHIAHYFGIAASTGRVGALFGMIRQIDAIDPETTPPARLAVLRKIVVAYAEAGNTVAIDAVLRYHASRTPFGSFDETVERIISESPPEVAAPFLLRRGTEILGDPTAGRAELEVAREYLERTVAGGGFELSLTAQNILPQLEQRLATLPPVRVDATVEDAQEASVSASPEGVSLPRDAMLRTQEDTQ